jgi:hypothetical protein
MAPRDRSQHETTVEEGSAREGGLLNPTLYPSRTGRTLPEADSPGTEQGSVAGI